MSMTGGVVEDNGSAPAAWFVRHTWSFVLGGCILFWSLVGALIVIV
jgi:hypothetical protein